MRIWWLNYLGEINYLPQYGAFAYCLQSRRSVDVKDIRGPCSNADMWLSTNQYAFWFDDYHSLICCQGIHTWSAMMVRVHPSDAVKMIWYLREYELPSIPPPYRENVRIYWNQPYNNFVFNRLWAQTAKHGRQHINHCDYNFHRVCFVKLRFAFSSSGKLVHYVSRGAVLKSDNAVSTVVQSETNGHINLVCALSNREGVRSSVSGVYLFRA